MRRRGIEWEESEREGYRVGGERERREGEGEA